MSRTQFAALGLYLVALYFMCGAINLMSDIQRFVAVVLFSIFSLIVLATLRDSRSSR